MLTINNLGSRMRILFLNCLVTFPTLYGCDFNSTGPDLEGATSEYYQALNESSFEKISSLYFDSVRVNEGIYSIVYSIGDFKHWFQWDSVFQPTYKVIEINRSDNEVNIIVSKKCVRTLFLNGEPTVTKETLTFKEGKIFSVQIKESISFNNKLWDENREDLVGWINENHPQLNGFIHDQSLNGGLNYVTALNLYQPSLQKNL